MTPAPVIITAQMGETLDALLWRIFARGSGMVEAVFSANRHLASVGPVLAEGTKVLIPVETLAPVEADIVNLWD